MNHKIGSQIKNSFTNKKFKNGAYSTILTIIIIIIAVFVNLFIKELDLKIDFSEEKAYTLTKQTHTIANDLKTNITLNYIVQDGNESDILEEVLNRYKKISSYISVKKIDPVLYPQFTSKYTKETVEDNSVIVVNEETQTAKYISYMNMFLYDYNSYQPKSIDIEGQITSAIQYVTTAKEDLPVLYEAEGHGEFALNSALQNLIEKLNFKLDKIETISIEKIPSDCDILLINGPKVDFSKEEAEMIKTYLINGGKAIIFAGETGNKMENFNKLLGYYGVGFEDGMILEEQGHYAGYPNYIIPNFESHEITSSIFEKKIPVVIPNSKGLLIHNNLRSSLTFETLLTTSDNSYAKVKEEWETYLKEKGDILGPFTIGTAIIEDYKDTQTKLVVYSSPSILDLDEEMVLSEQFGNQDLLLNSISWMTDNKTGLSIPAKSMTQKYLNVPFSQVVFWSILLILVIPISILGIGFFVWLRRRKC